MKRYKDIKQYLGVSLISYGFLLVQQVLNQGVVQTTVGKFDGQHIYFVFK